MASYRSGQNGQLFINTTNPTNFKTIERIQPIRDWNISFSQSVIDTTCLASKDKTIYPGVRSFSGGGTLLYYELDADNDSDTTFGEIMKALISPAQEKGNDNPQGAFWGYRAESPPTMVRMKLRIYPGGTTDRDGTVDTDSENIEFYAYITGFQVTCSVGEIITGNFTFEGHGPVLGNTF